MALEVIDKAEITDTANVSTTNRSHTFLKCLGSGSNSRAPA
jgi:hypothetical protein